MKRLALLVVITVLQISCSLPPQSTLYPAALHQDLKQRLMRISISSFGTQRFAGLIALKRGEESFEFVLLDPMGISLLAAGIDAGGETVVGGGIARLTDSRLPDLLAQSLRHIYEVTPAEFPCSTTLFSTLCQKTLDDGAVIKYFRNGPFTRWKVRYLGDADHSVHYERPWISFSLRLSDIGE